ncbi:hypothetical protein C0W92_02780 [Photobacterium angustum]|uniref:Fis family transcriptional regulator n=1 Tax=Photobacterium angustum TaxID=661 RepID=A0A855SEF1_PHOAN|nr:hypothetical protein [Photobacterium angustum]KJF83619.1 hypothetical protein UB36_03600 [Photobacterium damselae subsp. damselae]KJG31650.1 hypothetical protein UA69_08445 [Photobacterium angustum]KJG42512.1 hypothetical protein UA35_00450 [Photobacterium angustum]KJG47927.1 hypothetical protein UA31_03600 [Photobacterium angustum]KJG49809.1 hypothetical protein UA30_04580 [Photobacterium angustum]
MRKTDKKRDNTIVSVLTQVCHLVQEQDQGFQWLTHKVNYQDFPDSLTVTCVYDVMPSDDVKKQMCELIQSRLQQQAILLKTPARQVLFKVEK